MNTLITMLEHPVAERIGWSLVHLLWQGILVAVLLAGVLWLLRRRSANARYLSAGLALSSLPVLLVVTFVCVEVSDQRSKETTSPIMELVRTFEFTLPTPAIDRSVEVTKWSDELPPANRPVRFHPNESPKVENNEAVSPAATVVDNTEPPTPKTTSDDKRPALTARLTSYIEPGLPWIVGGWLLGFAALSLWHTGGWIALRRLRARGTSEVSPEVADRFAMLCRRLGLRRPIELFQSSRVSVPSLIGLLKPVVLLPVGVMTGLTPRQLEAILAHELAHVRRHDFLANLLQTAIETLLFFHPVVWWMSRRIRIERENCCDDIALEVMENPMLYAKSLSRLEELRHGAPAAPALSVAASGGSLLDRIKRVLGVRKQKPRRLQMSAFGLSGFAGLLALAVASLFLVPTAVEEAPAELKKTINPKLQQAIKPGDEDVPSTRLGNLTVLHKLEIAEFKPGVTVPLGNGNHRFDTIPKFLHGTRFTRRGGYQGILKFRVEKNQRVHFAVYGADWGGGGNSSGGWREELITRDQLKKQGWKVVGKIVGEHTIRKGEKMLWPVYARDCKAGESFAIRTHKYQAPILFSGELILNGLQVAHRCETPLFQPGAIMDMGNSAQRFDSIPPVLKGRRYTKRHPYQGILNFRVTKSQRVYFAVFGTDWGGGGNSSGGWRKELVTREQLKKQGWKEVGSIVGANTRRDDEQMHWPLFTRDCKSGESFAIRTHKYQAPILFFEADPKEAGKSSANSKQPGRPDSPLPLGTHNVRIELHKGDRQPGGLYAIGSYRIAGNKPDARSLYTRRLKKEVPDGNLEIIGRIPRRILTGAEFKVIEFKRNGTNITIRVRYVQPYPKGSFAIQSAYLRANLPQKDGKSTLPPGTYNLTVKFDDYEKTSKGEIGRSKTRKKPAIKPMTCSFVVPRPTVAKPLKAIPLGLGSLRIEKSPADAQSAGLVGVGVYVHTELPSAQSLYLRRGKMKVAKNAHELIGRLPGKYRAGERFELIRYDRAGADIEAVVRRIASKDSIAPLHSIYIRGNVPLIPAGKYTVRVHLEHLQARAGKLSPSGRTRDTIANAFEVDEKSAGGALRRLAEKSMAIKPTRLIAPKDRSRKAASALTELRILMKQNSHHGDPFVLSKRPFEFKHQIENLARTRRTWQLCNLLSHRNADVRIYAARGLAKVSDPNSVPMLNIIAKLNNHFVSGSETATLHMLFRSALKEALEKSTGMKLTPPDLKIITRSKDGKNNVMIRSRINPEYFPTRVDFKAVDTWLRGVYLAAGKSRNTSAGQPTPWNPRTVKRPKPDLHEIVRSRVFSNADDFYRAKPLEQMPAGDIAHPEARWFGVSRKAKYTVTTKDNNWLLFRTKQADDQVKIWVTGIERKGDSFTIRMTRSIWAGNYSVNITYHDLIGINLGKLPAGKYKAKWIIAEASHTEFDKENWPTNGGVVKKKAVELSTSFSVAAERKKPAVRVIKHVKSTKDRGTLSDAHQVVYRGEYSGKPVLLLAPPLSQRPKGHGLSQWFDTVKGRKTRYQPVAGEKIGLLLRTGYISMHDRAWIKRIERHGRTFTITMIHAYRLGSFYRNAAHPHIHAIDLGQLPAGRYTAKWVIEPASFKDADSKGWPKGKVTSEVKVHKGLQTPGSKLRPVVVTTSFAVVDAKKKAADHKRAKLEGKDLAALHGTWEVQHTINNGRKRELGFEYYRWSFDAMSKSITTDWKQKVIGAKKAKRAVSTNKFTMDVLKSPKQLTITGRRVTLKGIYEFKGKTLRIGIFGIAEKDRPKTFDHTKAGKGSGPLVIFVLKRKVKPKPMSGSIKALDRATKIVWINLGSRDGLRPKTVFEVHSPAIAAGKPGASRGRIEVTRIINPHLAEARILSEDLKQPMRVNDEVVTASQTARP